MKDLLPIYHHDLKIGTVDSIEMNPDEGTKAIISVNPEMSSFFAMHCLIL